MENNNTKKTGKKKERRKKTDSVGFEPGTFGSTRLHLTTTPLRLITEPWGKVFDLMPFGWTFRRQNDQAALTGLSTVKKNNANAYSMAMNEWKNIIMPFKFKLNKTTIHVLVCKVARRTYMFCYLNFRCYFEANGQNHINFRLIQVLKNSMAWHFLTFTSPSSKLGFVYHPCCGVEEQMLIFSSSLTPGQVKASWFEIQSLR